MATIKRVYREEVEEYQPEDSECSYRITTVHSAVGEDASFTSVEVSDPEYCDGDWYTVGTEYGSRDEAIAAIDNGEV